MSCAKVLVDQIKFYVDAILPEEGKVLDVERTDEVIESSFDALGVVDGRNGDGDGGLDFCAAEERLHLPDAFVLLLLRRERSQQRCSAAEEDGVDSPFRKLETKLQILHPHVFRQLAFATK